MSTFSLHNFFRSSSPLRGGFYFRIAYPERYITLHRLSSAVSAATQSGLPGHCFCSALGCDSLISHFKCLCKCHTMFAFIRNETKTRSDAQTYRCAVCVYCDSAKMQQIRSRRGCGCGERREKCAFEMSASANFVLAKRTLTGRRNENRALRRRRKRNECTLQ